jgi:hypothetical protein
MRGARLHFSPELRRGTLWKIEPCSFNRALAKIQARSALKPERQQYYPIPQEKQSR